MKRSLEARYLSAQMVQPFEYFGHFLRFENAAPFQYEHYIGIFERRPACDVKEVREILFGTAPGAFRPVK
jgi:hypothetical protein